MFGQLSNSLFEEINNSNNNLFAATPFGDMSTTVPRSFGVSSSPLFSSHGSSVFGQITAYGGFGSTTQSNSVGSWFSKSQPAFGSNLFGSSPFGASSQPAFGTPSTPAFDATSTPAFGDTKTPAFGATSTPAFGSSTTPAFGNTGSAFGTSVFGSSTPAMGASSTPPFGASSTPAFGASSTPTFGTPSTPAFDATSTPAFGATRTPAFGATSTPAFGSSTTPAFGNTGSAFGTSVFGSSTPAMGASSTPPFGASSTPAFGASSTPTFGASSTPAFGSSLAPAFAASSSPFSFWASPAFGQSTSAFGSSPFGATSTTFGAQSSPFGGQTTTPTFWSPGFGQPSFKGQQRGETRVTPYAPTPEADSGSVTQPAGKLESISAMPAYKEKSHEELRWEDYYSKYLGSRNRAACNCCEMYFNMNNKTQHTNPSANSSPAFGRPSTNLFAPQTSSFSAATSTPFWSTPSPAPSVYKSTPFAFPPSNSVFHTQAKGTTSASGNPKPAAQFSDTMNFKMNNTQQTNPFASSSPAFGQSNPFSFTISTNPFDPNVTSTFGTPEFGSSTPSLGSSPSTLVLIFNFKNMHLS